MTEIAVRHEEEATLVPVNTSAQQLVAWADALAAAHRIGTALCGTSFAPSHFRGKPDEAAAAILRGSELGLSPTMSLDSIYIISGKPGMYAKAMVALLLNAGHEVWTVEKSDTSVTVAGQRKGSEHVITETWTYERAKRAGYLSNKKYETDPQSMLYARAASDVCRQVAPDVLAGLYAVEELELTPGLSVTAPASVPTSVAALAPSPGPVEASADVPPSAAPGPGQTSIDDAEVVPDA